METIEKMNVHKALSELKVLDSRIVKVMENSTFTCTNKHSNVTIKGIPLDSYAENVRSEYQSLRDLIKRRDKIKRAVIMSNARTMVSIDGNEYTVAEAIETKNDLIPLYRRLLNKLTAEYDRAQKAAERDKDELQDRADDYVRALFGNADGKKNISADVTKVRNDFISAQTLDIFDPINVHEQIVKLDEFISGFLVEVDSALSVSNAITEIEII